MPIVRHDSSCRLLVFGLAVSALAALAACSRPHAAAESTADPPTVAVAKIERGNIAETLTLAAEFRPFQEIEVHAKVAGYVKAIHVDVGDRVAAGQLLAELEIPELQDELRQDDAGVRRYGEEIRRAQADLDRATSNHDMTHLASARLASVARERPKLIAQQDLDEAAARDRMAEAQVATAKAALAAAQQQLEVARAAHSKTQTLFGYARITAPFAGIVTQRYADTGAMIQAGTSSQTQTMPIVKLSQNDLLRLTIPVPESAVPRIRVGTPVGVRVETLDRTFPGTIARMADRLDPDTRTMHVEVDVSNPKLELVPGMYATASVVLDEVHGVLLAPVQALDRGEKVSRVLVVARNGRVEPRDVTVGLEDASRVQIASGLQDGEMVVIGNRAQLKPGTVVAPKVVAAAGAVAGAE